MGYGTDYIIKLGVTCRSCINSRNGNYGCIENSTFQFTLFGALFNKKLNTFPIESMWGSSINSFQCVYKSYAATLGR